VNGATGKVLGSNLVDPDKGFWILGLSMICDTEKSLSWKTSFTTSPSVFFPSTLSVSSWVMPITSLVDSGEWACLKGAVTFSSGGTAVCGLALKRQIQTHSISSGQLACKGNIKHQIHFISYTTIYFVSNITNKAHFFLVYMVQNSSTVTTLILL
jgi:hypothetical protein